MQPTYEQLLIQNKSLLRENQSLQSQLQGIWVEIQSLKAENQKLRVENQELKDKIKTNSSNSSKPPSQDPFRKRRQKGPTGKKRGGQQSHPGHSRALIPIEQVQTVHDLRPDTCPNCQNSNFDSKVVRTEIRQVLELPEISPEVTQFNIHSRKKSTLWCDLEEAILWIAI